MLKRLVEKYERFLRIEVDDQAETGMRMRAVWIIVGHCCYAIQQPRYTDCNK
ncbi:MAG: hypothetical protein GXP04_00430 [Alphaproteobacteria bacterium]|nr:hypothetical protein [Alphaproteobacteria bacterium]